MKTYSTTTRAAAIGLALSTLAALVLSACSEPAAKEVNAAGGPPITVAAVLEKGVVETQEFSGRLEAVEQVQVRTRVAGFIAAVNFVPGAEVKKGDVLFVIDPRPYQAEASRAEAAALGARAKAELAKTEWTRAEKLVADKAISQHDADEKAAGYKELDAAARAAQATFEAAALNLGFTKVTAPISGRISKAEVTLGNLVDSNVLLSSIVSSGQIYASFDGDEATYLRVAGSIRKGKPATVRIALADEAGYPHEGQLEFIDNRVDPATGSVRMRALLKNADGVLAPGLFAKVQLASGSVTGGAERLTTLIADRAVGTDQNRKFVYVVSSDNKAEYRQVKLGPVVDGLRIVRDGLQPGEKIIVNGLQRVHPGSAVTAQTVEMDAGLQLADKAGAPAADKNAAPEIRTPGKADAKAEHLAAKVTAAK